MTRIFLVVGLALLATSASAQTIVIEKQRAQPLGPRHDPVRVNVSLNFFLPGRIDGSEESARLQEGARRLVYEIAGRECNVLRETIAAECQLDNVNVNLNRHHSQPGIEGVNVQGNLGFRISLK